MRYTLLTDGPTDRVLRFPIEWILEQAGCFEFDGDWADPRLLPPASAGLTERIRSAVAQYPADLLIVHRDAEGEQLVRRQSEIQEAFDRAALPYVVAIAAVPIRMTEAWLLHDVDAIRSAAGNPNGKEVIHVPDPAKVESLPNPKGVLQDALMTAAELHGRRRRGAQRADVLGGGVYRVAELVSNWSPLRVARGFAALERELSSAVRRHRWR